MIEKFKTLFFVKSSLISLYLALTAPIPFISLDKFKIPILYNDQLILEKATENKVDLTINNSRKEASAANSFASISLFLIFILAIVFI